MSKIEITLEAFLRKHLPDFDFPVTFEVASDLSHGQLTSDVLLRYAQKVKRAPEEIAKGLSSKLSVFNNDFLVTIDSGYLNISIVKFAPEHFQCLQHIPNCQIFFPLSATGRTDSYFLRILSLATLQLILSRGKARLAVLSEQGIQEYPKFTPPLLDLKPSVSKCNIIEALGKFIGKLDSQSKHLTLWLSPEHLNKSEISKIYRECTDGITNLQIQIPHASWLKDLDQEIVLKYRELTETEERFKLNLLLSGFEPSTDLFYDEAMLPQRNNLGWYLQMSSERLKDLGVKAQSWTRNFDVESIPPSLRSLIWSILLLPGYRQKAVIKGLVPDYLEQVYLFLDRLNLFFNSPQLRQKIISQECNDLELDIMSVGLLIIQDLMETLNIKIA